MAYFESLPFVESRGAEATPIRALIAERDPVMRKSIRWLLESDPDVETQECATGEELLTALRRQSPDLLVLDVEIPEIRRAGGLRALGLERTPPAILTAYQPASLVAFQAPALHRLLKPFTDEQFQRALAQVKQDIQRDRREIRHAPASGGAARRYLQRFVIKLEGRIFLLRTDEVAWIHAAGNYMRLHSGGKLYTLRETMVRLESRLDPARFLRVHRNAIVNLDHVQEFQTSGEGMSVLLRDGTRIPLSRSYRAAVREILRGTI